MTLLQAFMYAAVAAGGIAIGIRWRRHKNAKTNQE